MIFCFMQLFLFFSSLPHLLVSSFDPCIDENYYKMYFRFPFKEIYFRRLSVLFKFLCMFSYLSYLSKTFKHSQKSNLTLLFLKLLEWICSQRNSKNIKCLRIKIWSEILFMDYNGSKLENFTLILLFLFLSNWRQVARFHILWKNMVQKDQPKNMYTILILYIIEFFNVQLQIYVLFVSYNIRILESI